jgi:hypothetical protein
MTIDPVYEEWISSIDLTKTRVVRFPSLILICGGPVSKEITVFKSCRDIFYQYVKNSQTCLFRDNVILAEEIFSYFEHSSYKDLISFEKDLVELSSLTVLFSESPGSIAELGSFSVLPKVQDRLLVVMHEDDALKESFIWRGPALHLKNLAEENGKEDPISIYNWQKLHKDDDILTPNDFSDAESLSESIEKIFTGFPKTAGFKKDQVGHVMLLVLDLLSIIHLATIDEIHNMLNYLGINNNLQTVKQHVSLLLSLGYAVRKPYQNNIYYLPSQHVNWLSLAFMKGAKIRDKDRWRRLFVEYYSRNQIQKHRALKSYMKARSTSGDQT